MLPIAAVAEVSKGGGSVITAEMVKPITDMVTQNVGVLVPVGITIMGIMVGVGLIPRIIYKFL